jgi:hypothetical protein
MLHGGGSGNQFIMPSGVDAAKAWTAEASSVLRKFHPGWKEKEKDTAAGVAGTGGSGVVVVSSRVTALSLAAARGKMGASGGGVGRLGGGGGGCLAESGARISAALVGSASSPASLFGGAAGTQVLSESPESVRAAAWREYLDSTSGTPVPAQISAMEVECKQVFKQLLSAIPAQQKAAGACEDDAVSALVSPEGLLPQIPVGVSKATVGFRASPRSRSPHK